MDNCKTNIFNLFIEDRLATLVITPSSVEEFENVGKLQGELQLRYLSLVEFILPTLATTVFVSNLTQN